MKDKIIAKHQEKEEILNKIIKHWQKLVHANGDIRVDWWEFGLKQLESTLVILESELTTLKSQEMIEIKFTAANILQWVQNGHAVAPRKQVDLLNYLIAFVNHFKSKEDGKKILKYKM